MRSSTLFGSLGLIPVSFTLTGITCAPSTFTALPLTLVPKGDVLITNSVSYVPAIYSEALRLNAPPAVLNEVSVAGGSGAQLVPLIVLLLQPKQKLP